jgi:hypothetical protein
MRTSAACFRSEEALSIWRFITKIKYEQNQAICSVADSSECFFYDGPASFKRLAV